VSVNEDGWSSVDLDPASFQPGPIHAQVLVHEGNYGLGCFEFSKKVQEHSDCFLTSEPVDLKTGVKGVDPQFFLRLSRHGRTKE